MSTSSSDSIPDTFQTSFYIAINIENVLYGIELALYFKTMSIMLSNREANKKSILFHALFSSIMVFLSTVWVSSLAIFGQKMWLLDSDFPGGPDAYLMMNISTWYMDWGTTAVVVMQLMTDGLMIYRCWIIWDCYRAIVIPIFLWLTTLVLGVLVDWTSSSPGGDFHTNVVAQLSLAYYTVAVFLNTALTCMTCCHIVRHGWRVQEHLGNEYASSYFAVVKLVIESMLPYTLSGIALLVSLGVGSTMSIAFLSVYSLLMCISPQMLILRVFAGRARDEKISKQPNSTVKFSPASVSGSQWIGNRAKVDVQTSDVCLPDGRNKVVISEA